MQSRLGWGAAGGRYGLLQSPVTDLGNTVVLAALATGGVLHVLSGSLAADPGAVAAWLAGRGVEYLKVVPSHLAALAAGAGPGAGAAAPVRGAGRRGRRSGVGGGTGDRGGGPVGG